MVGVTQSLNHADRLYLVVAMTAALDAKRAVAADASISQVEAAGASLLDQWLALADRNQAEAVNGGASRFETYQSPELAQWVRSLSETYRRWLVLAIGVGFSRQRRESRG